MDRKYDMQSLKDGIVRAELNVKIFEDALAKEKETIEQYQEFIKELEKEDKPEKK